MITNIYRAHFCALVAYTVIAPHLPLWFAAPLSIAYVLFGLRFMRNRE